MDVRDGHTRLAAQQLFIHPGGVPGQAAGDVVPRSSSHRILKTSGHPTSSDRRAPSGYLHSAPSQTTHDRAFLERTTGFEPATPTLARC